MAETKQQETVSPVDGSVYAIRQLAGKGQRVEALTASAAAGRGWN